MDYYIELIQAIKDKDLNKQEISKLKLRLCSKYRMAYVPTDIDVLLHAEKEDFHALKKLQTKPVRTISGVTVIAVMTKPFRCPHGKCIMCPGGPESYFGDVPQSYTDKAPAIMRAKRNNWDPYFQVLNRLEQYVVLGHSFDKIDLIIMGGTFISTPKRYQEDFVMYSFKAMNDFSRLFFVKGKFDLIRFKNFFELPGEVDSKERYSHVISKMEAMKKKNIRNLEYEQDYNDKVSKIKCIGLTIETRPDYAKTEHCNQMLNLGCTRVELGVQSTREETLKAMGRGHSAIDAIESTRILKDLCFKVNYHMMPGGPGSDKSKDLEDLKEIVLNPKYRPDMLKIYPCMVFKGTGLYELWRRKKFVPLSTREAAHIIAEFKRIVPPYMRIMRVQRDVPSYMTEAGVDKTNLRQYVQEITKKENIKCRCIRCREPRSRISGIPKIKTLEYEASGGREFFISVEDAKNDCILGFCRLRLSSQSLRKEISCKTALVRELHVYGSEVQIGEKNTDEELQIQHRGFGKKLLKEAESLAKKEGCIKIIVISGIGVRGYYRKLGYKKQGPYMAKNL